MKKKKRESLKFKKSKGGLMISFMPYSEIAHIETVERIKKIMGLVLQNKIIILQGRLKPEEETRLIENTMTLIGNIKGFQGVEIAVITNDSEHQTLFEKVRRNIARILIGDQDSITIIGPASIVKEIKKDPKKIELMLKKR